MLEDTRATLLTDLVSQKSLPATRPRNLSGPGLGRDSEGAGSRSGQQKHGRQFSLCHLHLRLDRFAQRSGSAPSRRCASVIWR
jgi:hypothetical protein